MDGVEIFGELLGGALETAAVGNDENKGCGCLIAIGVMLIALIGIIICIETTKPGPKPIYIKGKIVYKLDKDEVLLESKSGKKIYHLDHELYINKKEGDSLCIMR